MELLGGPSKIRWSTVASLLPGARRTGKQARERWHNQLNPETASKVRRARARAMCTSRSRASHHPLRARRSLGPRPRTP